METGFDILGNFYAMVNSTLLAVITPSLASYRMAEFITGTPEMLDEEREGVEVMERALFDKHFDVAMVVSEISSWSHSSGRVGDDGGTQDKLSRRPRLDSERKSAEWDATFQQMGIEDTFKCQQQMSELVDTEKKYVKRLKFLVDAYVRPMRELLSPADWSLLFRHIEVMYKVNMSFLANLLTLKGPGVGMLMIRFAPRMRCYGRYSARIHRAMERIKELEKEFNKIRLYLRKQEMDPKSDGLDISSLLMEPVQRIMRYPMILKSMLAEMEEDSEEYRSLARAVLVMSQVGKAVDEKRATEERWEQAKHIRTILMGVDHLKLNEKDFLRVGVVDRSVYGRFQTRESCVALLYNSVLLWSTKVGDKMHLRGYQELKSMSIHPLERQIDFLTDDEESILFSLHFPSVLERKEWQDDLQHCIAEDTTPLLTMKSETFMSPKRPVLQRKLSAQ